jgi:type IV fimbrial biogenesis protein FimT
MDKMPTFNSFFKQARYQLGFTMTELMVTMAILAILLSIAVPSFEQTIAASRLTTATNDLYIAMAQARSDAMRQGQRMTICKSSNGADCDPNATWNSGWITITDGTRDPDDANPTVDEGETINSTVQAMHPSIVIQGNSSFQDYISFAANGQSKSYGGGFNVGSLRVCSTSAALTDDTRARDLVVNFPGRVVIRKVTGVLATCPAPA